MELAGLAYSFQPVSLPRGRTVERGGEPQPRPRSSSGGNSGGGSAWQPTPVPNTNRSVAFNLKERRPGPAYNSPEGSQVGGNSRPGSPAAAAAAESTGATSRPASLVHLKLASLRRKAVGAQAGNGMTPTTPQTSFAAATTDTGVAPQPPVQVEDRLFGRGIIGSVEDTEPMLLPPNSPGPPALAGRQAPTAAEANQRAALLCSRESMLAGCSSRVIQEPPPATLPPHHVLVGMPVLAVPPMTAEQPADRGSTQADSSLATIEASSRPATVQPQQPGFQIAAYRPPTSNSESPTRKDSTPASLPAASGSLTGAACGGASAAVDTAASHAAGAIAESPADAAVCGAWLDPPATLEAALRCLGLLASELLHASRGIASSSCWELQGTLCFPANSQPCWVLLRSVQLVLEAKRAAAEVLDLLPLVRRLQQVNMHLVLHQANLGRGRSRSPRQPRRTGGSPAGAPPPPGPWLSGRSSAVVSKHRSSRSSSPGRQLHPRPKVLCPSREASELQVQLLSSLQVKLLLKLGLAVLRQAAAVARLRTRLLELVAARGAADMCRSILLCWLAAAAPSQQQETAARAFSQLLTQRQQRAQLAAWRRWAEHTAWQGRQLALGHAALRRRQMAAGVQHWRCYCQQQLVQRLQAALAARWLASWGRRRVFAAWRRTANRSALLKASLLGHECLTTGMRAEASSTAGSQRQPLPSQLQALAITVAAFGPVKAFVAEAVQQLQQLCKGLRYAEGRVVLPAEQQLDGSQRQPHSKQGATMGSLEALLALVPPPKLAQPQQQPQCAAPTGTTCSLATQSAAEQQGIAECMQLPAAAQGISGAAASGEGRSEAAPPAAAPEPAPDPGSPTKYNPASYASPARLSNPQTQQQHQHRSSPAGHAGRGQRPTAAASQPAAVVEEELFECQEQVQRLRFELAQLEQDSEKLQQRCAELEMAGKQAQQAACDQQQACAAAAAAKEATASAMQLAVQQHATAVAESSAQERLVQQRQQEAQEVEAAAAGARAAVNAALELQALSNMGVQRWSKAVESLAKELAACHRTQQAPVMVRLKEARQRLDQHQQEVAAVQQQLAQLQVAATQAEQRAKEVQQAAVEAQQGLLAAVEDRAGLRQQLDTAMARHEAAAVEAVAAAQAASAAEQQQRLLAAQQQAVAGRLRQAAQQVLRKQREAVQLQYVVLELQQRRRDVVEASLASIQPQRRSALKRRLHVVQEQEHGSGALPSPTAVQQRRPAPEPTDKRSGVGVPGLAAPVLAMPCAATVIAAGNTWLHPSAGDAGPLALRMPLLEDWSCSSSDLGSPLLEADAPLAPPLTVDEAAAHFYARCLLRRAMRVLRQQAATTRLAMEAVAAAWQHQQLVAILHAWHSHAADAAGWLAEAAVALRRRWLLRQWRAVAAEQCWLHQAEAGADRLTRRQLLRKGVAAWRQHVHHEHWRDAVHEEVMLARLRSVLKSWRAWTRQRRQKAARLHTALVLYQRRLLQAAVRQWCWVQHSKALLHRVFSTAINLWQEEVGVRLHQRNYELAASCWATWQLFVLQQQEERRQAMLRYAADAHREQQLVGAGLSAFRQALVDARELQRLEQLQAHMFTAWRHLAATSVRHWDYEAARRHRHAKMLRCTLAAWHSACEGTAEMLAHFWLRWQVQAPLRRVLLGWQAQAAAQHKQRVLDSVAAVHHERQLQQWALTAFAAQLAAVRTCSTSSPRAPQQAHCKRYSVANTESNGAPRHAATGRGIIGHCCSSNGGAGFNTAVNTSHGGSGPQAVAPAEQQEQVNPHPPAAHAACASASGKWSGAEGHSSTVNDWRAAAEYWRLRHQSYCQRQQHLPSVTALPDGISHPQEVRVNPHTAATLLEVRAQWRQT